MKISKFAVSMMALVMACMVGGVAYADLDDGLIPYFPVTLGTSWTYDNGKTVIVSDLTPYSGKFDVEISNVDNSGQVFLEVTENDVKSTGYSNPDYIMVKGYFDPVTLIKFPMILGTSWTETITSNGYHPVITCEVTQVGLIVEAGGNTYHDCIELTWSIEYPDGYDWPNPLVSRKLYFDETAGCIKRINYWQDESETTMEVVDYFIAPPVPVCEGDFDNDGDVDGSDLAVFAADFGRTDCDTGEECEGDFDHDNDVDGSDLAVFAADFGRTDCPH